MMATDQRLWFNPNSSPRPISSQHAHDVRPPMIVEIPSPPFQRQPVVTVGPSVSRLHNYEGREEDIPPIDSMPSSDTLGSSHQRPATSRRPLGDITSYFNHS
mmetsp:Transcript_22560/g.49202  ORF Transcript_22560/g.49202 Transcript_22560/m.49202 type:complete len:102 (+) Transcript_22560:187-492(+)